MELRRPSIALVASYLESIAEMTALGEVIWESMIPRAGESLDEFVERVLSSEDRPEPGRVADSCYWAVEGEVVVGRIALRHHLTASLEEFGGHIGYEVRPSFRRRGVASEMLRQLLDLPRARAMGRILVTCAPDNVGSNKAIVACGGVLTRTAFVEKWQRQTNYYWFDLPRS